jgi:pre-mRNA-splicing factor ATP-dependent RNA helicase DHX15/PRP43
MNVMKAYDELKANSVSAEEVTQWCWDNYLNVRSLKAAENVREQLRRMLVRAKRSSGVEVKMTSSKYTLLVKKALLHGYFMSLAVTMDKDNVYSTLVKPTEIVLLHPSTIIDYKPEWVMYTEFVLTGKKYIRTVTAIDGNWLKDVNTDYFSQGSFTHDAKKKLERIFNKEEVKKPKKAESEDEEEVMPKKKRSKH